MSAPTTVDICPSSFLSYVVAPIEYVYVATETSSVSPQCVNGQAPYRIYLTIYQSNAPYNGTVSIYVDDNLASTLNVTDGVVDTVVLAAPGTHTVSISTMQGNTVTLNNVNFTCI